MAIKLVFAAAALSVGLSSAAFADSVIIATKLEVPGNPPVVMEKEIGFRPKTDVIVIEVAGKKCSFGSSKQGSLKGCNYTITIDNSGAREADSTCMNFLFISKFIPM